MMLKGNHNTPHTRLTPSHLFDNGQWPWSLKKETRMKAVKASEFKARCLQLMDEVAETREPVVVTPHGKPVCQVIPYKPKPKTLFGMSKDTITINGDIISLQIPSTL
jgi:prevent-host-death family protein